MIGPSFEEMLDQVVTSRLQSVWTALPGRVLAFDAHSSTCSVQPYPAIYQDGEAVEMPALSGVPVSFPAGGGASITWPLNPGDRVLLIFASASLARSRTDGSEADPQDLRRFDLSDAWAIPVAAAGQPAATPLALVVTPPTAGQVRLGSDLAVQAAVLGDLLLTWLNAHTHTTAMGPTSPPNIPAGAAMLSPTVKVI